MFFSGSSVRAGTRHFTLFYHLDVNDFESSLKEQFAARFLETMTENDTLALFSGHPGCNNLGRNTEDVYTTFSVSVAGVLHRNIPYRVLYE